MPQERRKGQSVIARWHEGHVILKHFSESASLINSKVINDRFHRKWHRVLQFAFGLTHKFLQPHLPRRFAFRREDEAHPTPGYPSKHPKAPEFFLELAADSLD